MKRLGRSTCSSWQDLESWCRGFSCKYHKWLHCQPEAVRLLSVLSLRNRQISYHERAVRMLESSMSGKNRIVRLHDGVGESGGRIYTEFQLWFLSIVGGETLKDECTETRTSSATERMENEEALEAWAVVCKAAYFIHHNINLLFSNSVVTTSIWNTCKWAELRQRGDYLQLLAASSFPVTRVSGWKRLL